MIERDDAIELLQRENVSLTALFDELDDSTGPSVIDRSRHGEQSKRLIRRLASRESAKADISRVLETIPELNGIHRRIVGDVDKRRSAINELDLMARGVRGIDLGRMPEFDPAVWRLREIVLPEIMWELAEAVPAVRRSLSERQRASLHTAHYLRRHAPTKLAKRGPCWYERARVVSWLITVWDHALDRPLPHRGAQAR